MRKMRFIFCLFFLIIILTYPTGCKQLKKEHNTISTQMSDNDGTAEIVFETLEHDFGKIVEGSKVSYVFNFKNTGTGTLIISSVETSCGCTVTRFSNKPVHPGGKGKLKVILDSSGKSGHQLNTVEITSNAFRKIMVLIITAEVV